MNTRWLLRAALLARRSPSRKRIIMMGIVLFGVALIAGIEHFIGWPEWATMERPPRRR